MESMAILSNIHPGVYVLLYHRVVSKHASVNHRPNSQQYYVSQRIIKPVNSESHVGCGISVYPVGLGIPNLGVCAF